GARDGHQHERGQQRERRPVAARGQQAAGVRDQLGDHRFILVTMKASRRTAPTPTPSAYERTNPGWARRSFEPSSRHPEAMPLTAPSTTLASKSAVPWKAARPGPSTSRAYAASMYQPLASTGGSRREASTLRRR